MFMYVHVHILPAVLHTSFTSHFLSVYAEPIVVGLVCAFAGLAGCLTSIDREVESWPGLWVREWVVFNFL